MRANRGRIVGTVVLMTAAATVATACSAGPSASTDNSPSIDSIAAVVLEATAAGADPSQIELFDDGVITYADYELAMNHFISCATDSGFQVPVTGTVSRGGVTVLNYTITPPRDGDIALADACYERYAYYVDSFWQTSSSDAIAFAERRAAALAAPLRQCLAGYGVDVAQDASFDELTAAAIEHLSVNQQENCLSDIGYSSWEG